MTPCRSCGSQRTVLKGSRTYSVRTLADGRAVERPMSVRRVLCKDCGARGQDATELEEAARRFLDELGAMAVRVGVAGAAQAVGVDRKQARAGIAAWLALREADLPERLPERLALVRTTLIGKDRLMLVDAGVEAILDILPDASPEAFEAWLARKGDQATRTVIGPADRRFEDAVSAVLPGAGYAVPPSEARPVVAQWAAMVLRRPTALERHRAILARAAAEDVERHVERVAALAAELGEQTVLAQVARWGGPMRAGAGGGFLDARLRGMTNCGQGWQRASFERLRGRLLMDEGPRVFAKSALGATLSLGVPAAHVERILREGDAGDDATGEAPSAACA